jgi:hypothetical protein
MKTIETHPSYLALDRLVLGKGDRDVVEHVRGCATCREHLEQLLSPTALPASLWNLGAPPWWRRLLAHLTPRRVTVVAATAALALAGGRMLSPGGPAAPPGPPEPPGTEADGYLAA